MNSGKWLIIVLMILIVSGCKTPDADINKETATEDKKLRVATSLPYGPMEFYDDSGNIAGLDIDIIKAIAGKLGRELEIKNYPRDEMFGAVRTGEADLMIAAIKITPENSQEFLFSSPYFETGQVIVARTLDKDIEDYKYYCPETKTFTLEISVIDEEREELISIEYDAEPFEPLEEIIARQRAEMESDEPEASPDEEPSEGITQAEAEEIALDAYPGEVNLVEIERYKGIMAFKVEVDRETGGELDVFVDKQSGEILGTES